MGFSTIRIKRLGGDLKRVEKIHKCTPPGCLHRLFYRVCEHDRWECDCGCEFTFSKIDDGYGYDLGWVLTRQSTRRSIELPKLPNPSLNFSLFK